jgi:hypothetical protein
LSHITPHRAACKRNFRSADKIRPILSRSPSGVPRFFHPNSMKEAEMAVIEMAAVMPPVRVKPHFTHAPLPAR